MCGIGAISLSPTSKIPLRQLAHELLLHSEERGKVASGFGYSYAGQTIYLKQPKPGGHLPLKQLPRDARTVIVHTRNATYGDPEENDNNHPVVDDKEQIILVHNGVITNHKAIRDGEKDVVFPEVDSSVLPWLVREYGPEGLQHTDGWAAVAWLDQSAPGELNLARMKGSAPMVVVYLDDGSTVMGSTFQILHASLINIGYGDRIVGGWEVPDHTHLRIASGTILGVGNLPVFSAPTAKYKGTAMSWQEKQRLEKVTNGDAVSYSKDNPVHSASPTSGAGKSPSSTPPSPSTASLVGAGVNPSTPNGSVVVPRTSYTAPPPQPRVQLKPGEDPMAAFNRQKQVSPPTQTVHTTRYGSYWDDVGKKHAAKKPLPNHPIPAYLEQRLRYWISWADDKTHTVDTDTLFLPADVLEDDGYLFNIFMDVLNDSEQRGLIHQWGILDENGDPRYLNEAKDEAEVITIMKRYAEKIGPKPKRSLPKDVADRVSGAATSGSEGDPDDEDEYLQEEQSLRDLMHADARDLGFNAAGVVIDLKTKQVVPLDDIEDVEWAELFWKDQYGEGSEA